MDQLYFPSTSMLHLSPDSISYPNSTAYPTDSEGPDTLFPNDDSLQELLNSVSLIPNSAFSYGGAEKEEEDDDGFSFSFPPLKNHIGNAQRDLNRPTIVRSHRL